MQPAVLIRLRPIGPWRFGAGEGGDHRLDPVFRSDRVFSAVTLAMQQLGFLDEWLDATVRSATPVATFSSLFPFQGDTLFAPPPASHWPPPPALLTSPSPVFLAKMRWEAVHFIPLNLVEALVTGQQVLADQWVVDAESGCLLRRDRPSQSPFRFSSRPRAAVDRLTSASRGADSAACVEFESGAGLWLTVRFALAESEKIWGDRLRAAFRLLADTGFGGRRGAGWGQTLEPEWQSGSWPGILFPRLARNSDNAESQSSNYWLLSLYSPHASDEVNWKAGDYRLTVRGGRVQSLAGSGNLKKTVRMVSEGSVIHVSDPPVGTAIDVAPDGFAHPVYRSGLALALRLPVIRQVPDEPVEVTPPESSLEAAKESEIETDLPTSEGSPLQSDLLDEEQPTPDAEGNVVESGEFSEARIEAPVEEPVLQSDLIDEVRSAPEPDAAEEPATPDNNLEAANEPAMATELPVAEEPAPTPESQPDAAKEEHSEPEPDPVRESERSDEL